MTDSDANSTLTDDDRTLLAALDALDAGAATASALADRSETDRSADELRERLDFMADNGLLRRSDDGTEEYELTDDGRRLLRAPGDGSADETIDAPDEVVATLRDRGLRADRLDAALGAFAFLRFWGAATASEIADGAFSEEPLAFDSAAAWWDEFARDHLAALPGVDPPETDGGFWRFDGPAGVDDISEDGRKVVFGRVRGDDAPEYASATEAMAEAGLSDDRRLAVAAALSVLQRSDAADDATLREAAERTRDAGANVDDSWLDSGLFDALERLPGVVREGDADAGRWRYTLGPDGYGSA